MKLFPEMKVRDDKYLYNIFSAVPDASTPSVVNPEDWLEFVEDAYNNFLHDRGNVFSVNCKLMYGDYNKYVHLSVEEAEQNILAWYQFFDALVCGEV